MALTLGGPISAAEYVTHVNGTPTFAPVETRMNAPIGGTEDIVLAYKSFYTRSSQPGADRNVILESYGVANNVRPYLEILNSIDEVVFKAQLSSGVVEINSEAWDVDITPGSSSTVGVVAIFVPPSDSVWKVVYRLHDEGLFSGANWYYSLSLYQADNTMVAGDKVAIWDTDFSALLVEGGTEGGTNGLSIALGNAGRFGKRS